MVDEGQITLRGAAATQQAIAPGAAAARTARSSSKSPTSRSTFSASRRCKDLLGSLGKSSFGRHDTRDLATGIEASGASKPYEFGDTLNLDISETLFSRHPARRRASCRSTWNTRDLHVHQCEYQSSCATVLMLDCSHCMILYGEDRFTPGQESRAGAGAPDPHAISRRLACAACCSTIRPRNCAVSQLARVQVGPYYTNTRDGLILAQRLLQPGAQGHEADRHDHRRQAVGLTLEDGRMYKNAFGLDPLVISRTLEEVESLQEAGHSDQHLHAGQRLRLVNFVQKVTEICRGKAYFTTPYTLGQYLLMDYMNRKTRTIH